MATPDCRKFERHFMSSARCLALANEGSSRDAKIAMMAITVNNSINVNTPFRRHGVHELF